MRGEFRPPERPLGHLPDGTAYYAPLGEMPVDQDAGLVQCHLCGRWFRQLHHSHLGRHGMTVDEYRAAFGLLARHPLQAPDLSELRSRTMQRLIRSDDRVKAGVEVGLELARSGRLRELREEADVGRSSPLEATRRRQSTALAMGRIRTQRLLAAREQRARELGHPSLESYLRSAHASDRRAVADIARELGVGPGTVVRDLERLGISRIPLNETRAIGRQSWASAHATRRTELLHELGFATLEQYVTDSRRRGLTQETMAAQLGVHVRTLRRLLKRMNEQWEASR